jgi:hypothetical protein
MINLMDNNLNVIKTISEPKIRRAVEKKTTFLEICCISKGVSCEQQGSSKVDGKATRSG